MRKFIFVTIVSLGTRCAFSQAPDSLNNPGLLLDKIKNALPVYSSLCANEYVYLQTDRPVYAPGDSLWFQAQLVIQGLPFSYSRVLYADIADSSGNILVKCILPVDSMGGASGSLAIPAGWKTGFYNLRAYTAWMLNREEEPGYSIPFAVNKNGLVPPHQQNPTESSFYSLFFYPEGGHLLEGLSNRLAIQSLRDESVPCRAKGFILNAHGDTLADFDTGEKGFSGVSLEIPAEQKCFARVTWPDGSIQNIDLPVSVKEGVLFQTAWAGNKLYYKIETSGKRYEKFPWYLLLADIKGSVIYSAIIPWQEGKTLFNGNFPADSLGQGAIHMTVMAPGGKVMAERTAWHERKNTRELHLIKDTLNLEPRGRNVFTIQLPDTLIGSYTISIVDASLGSAPWVDPGINDRLLFSVIPGLSSLQAASLDRSNAKTTDWAMMILAGRGQQWNQVLSGGMPTIRYIPEIALQIKGRVLDRKNNPVSGIPINFLVKQSDSSSFFINDSLDDEGRFVLDDLAFADSARFYWKTKTRKNTEGYTLIVEPGYADTVSHRKKNLIPPVPWNDAPFLVSDSQLLEKYSGLVRAFGEKAKELPTVYVTEKKISRIEELDRDYTWGTLFGGRLAFTQSFDMENENSASLNILAFLAGRVPGLRINGNSFNPVLTWVRGQTLEGTSPVIFFLNETRMDDPSVVSSLSMSDIAYVKVFRPPHANMLVNTYALVIAVFTKKGISPGTRSKAPSLDYFTRKGFNWYFPFQQPPHAGEASSLPDKRITLYWDSRPVWEKGRTRIVFYNNDFSRRLLLRVEGINEAGEPLSYEEIIE